MKYLSLVSLLFLVSCLNGKDTGSPEKFDPEIRCLCTDLPNWSVISKTKAFPENFMISYEGEEIVNTCTGRNRPVRERQNDEFVIKYEFPEFPENPFKFEIVDLGKDCSENEVIYSGNPNYSTAVVTPEGQKSDYQVYVYLD